jgi:hypothetical protein
MIFLLRDLRSCEMLLGVDYLPTFRKIYRSHLQGPNSQIIEMLLKL